MNHLVQEILRRSAAGERLAFCAVVRALGSTPQGAGAAMLVLADGKTLGTLGGGCVEAEVRVRALVLMQEGRGRLLTFRLDHDYGWDDGLICGGTMDVAVQVVAGPDDATEWRRVGAELSSNRPADLSLVVPDDQGQPAEFHLPLPPRPTLLIAGAGRVGQALSELAAKCDFDVVVVDDRPDLADPARFPGAACVAADIEATLVNYPIDAHTYVVIVTRGHRHDGRALAAVVASPAAYVGMIGSKRKVRTILDELHAAGTPRARLLRVHAPVGLEIGAVTPAEIAVSIMAELIAVRRGRGDVPAAPMKIAIDRLIGWLDRGPGEREAESA